MILRVENIKTFYGKINVLSEVSIKVEPGHIVSILGANGAGKSTLLMAISGIVPIREGEIYFLEKRIDGLPPFEIVRAGISQVPEGRRIFRDLTVEENLQLGAFLRKKPNEKKDNLEMVFDRFPRLKERKNQRGGTLSGGEQQMLAISRGLMTQPKLLMLDEPSLGLSPILVKEIFRIIKSINESGTTILVVEQNVNKSLSISDYGYILVTGRVSISGPGKELVNNEEVKEAYLGKGKYGNR